MDNLINELRAYGADTEGAMKRFMDDTELYETCYLSFVNDKNFELLGQALAEKNYCKAFDATHTLKGVAGNLGLTPLFNSICEIVEPLRVKDYNNLTEKYEKILLQQAVLKNML